MFIKTKFHKILKKEDEVFIQCKICPNNCILKNNQIGVCGVRQNRNTKLCLLTYGIASSVAIDPVEKKPLYHFYPGDKVLSIGNFGCNFKCRGCQNYNISIEFTLNDSHNYKLSPKQIIALCKEKNIRLLAFTYNEPLIAYEYVFDTFKLAKKNNIKTVLVSNGYVNIPPLKMVSKYIDAANIDIKAFDDDIYLKYSCAKLKPVLDSIIEYKKNNVWVEITYLIVPSVNDDLNQIENMCKWIKNNLGKNTPLHFSRFYPLYKASELEPTSLNTLEKARMIADKYLDYVYIGNVSNIKENNNNSTFCPSCNNKVIARMGYSIENELLINKCSKCKTKISGVFND